MIGGVGGTGVKVDNVVIVPPSAGTASATDTRVIYRNPHDETWSCYFDGSNPVRLGARTTQITVAGPNVWACWEGPNPGQRTFLSSGDEIDNAWAPMAAGRDDALLIGHRVSGVGLRCYVGATMVWEDPTAVICFRTLPQAFALDGYRCVWADPAGKLYARGVVTPQQQGPAYDPFLIEAPDGRVWVGYHNDRCIMHPIDDASHGYILDTGVTYATTANQSRVAWSRDEAEGQMESVEIDWSRPTVSLVPQGPPIYVPPFSRPCLIAPYHATRHGKSVFSVGHVEIITNGEDPASRRMRRHVIADIETVDMVPEGELYAVFADTHSDLDIIRAKADQRGVPMIVYHDHITAFPEAVLAQMRPGWDIVSTKHYCDWNEPVDIFKARSHWQVEQVNGRGFRILLTVQAFDRNGYEQNRAKLGHISAFWHELFETHSDTCGLAPFAVLRDSVDVPSGTILPLKGGIYGQADLTAWWDAYGVRVVAPPIPVRPVVPPPVVTPPAPPPVQPPPPKESDDVTPQQIAEVLAGRDFERIATLLTLPGTDVAARRPAVHAWIRDRIVALDASYQQVFGRPVDLEGAGSRVLLALEGKTDAEIHQLLIRDKQNGAQ
jgi:hypothetical protein